MDPEGMALPEGLEPNNHGTYAALSKRHKVSRASLIALAVVKVAQISTI
jgi:hypothetical protein